MRKILTIISAALMSFVVFCGCSVNKTNMTEEAVSLPEIVIGSDNYEPYNYVSGDFTGVDVELAKAAFAKLGYKPVFKQIVWEKKDYYLESGQVDCLWGCFTMTDREDKYIWAGPYLKSKQTAVVCADSEINSISDLTGKRVAVQASTKPEEILLKCETPDIPKAEWVYSFSGMDEVYASLRKGYADAICGHEGAVSRLVTAEPGEYRMLDGSLYVSELGVAFSKNYHNPKLASQLTDVLLKLNSDGTTQRILEKYGLDKSDITEAKK